MTISLAMGTKRPKRISWHEARSRQEGTSGGGHGPSDDGQSLAEDGLHPGVTEPPMFGPENDLALARMMGCAFLFGLACIAGLVILLV